jgi:hypothetical protein
LKRLTITIFLSALICGQAFAQFSGQLSGPAPVKEETSQVGGFIGLYEDAIGVLGQYRYGVGGYTDIGFKLGIIDPNNNRGGNTGLDAAFDLKYLVLEQRLHDPIDLSIGGVFEGFFASGYEIFSIGAYGVGSYPVKLRNGRILEPYGRLIMRVERTNTDFNDNTDFQIGFNMGTSFELNNHTKAFAELQFDDPFAFFMGLEFGI